VDVVTVGGAEVEPTLKVSAIGADHTIRVDTPAMDGFMVAKELQMLWRMVVDLVIAGRESIDYNGGMVPEW
jgi:electron transfer flavoprotein beta subunit